MRESLAIRLLFALLGIALLAKAQEEPSRFDLYGGYYYARVNVAGCSSIRRANFRRFQEY